MLNKSNDDCYIITEPEDFKELKSRDKFIFKCIKCGKIIINVAGRYRPCHVDDYKRMLCTECKRETYLNNLTPEEKSIFSEKVSKGLLNRSPENKAETYNRVKQTKLEKYGDENYNNIEKINNTKLEKYGDVKYNNKEKTEKTCLEKYGYKTNLLSPEYNRKIKTIIKNRYGTECYIRSSDFKEKAKRTNIIKHGKPTWMTFNSPEYIEYMQNKYGDNWRKRNSDKAKETSYKLYGRLKRYNRYNYYGIFFDSSWELAVWIYCIDHNINIIREPCYFIYKYSVKNKIYKKNYYPDFMIDGKLVEIKGDYFFNDIGKMIDVFDRDNDYVLEAKHRCGLQNGVLFWTKKDIVKYIDYVKITYSKDYLNKFRIDNPYNPSYWCYYINNTYIPNYYNNSNYIKGKGISPYDIDNNSEYSIAGKGVFPFD